MNQGVDITDQELQHRKTPQNAMSAEMKERRIMKEPTNLVQEHLMQKHQAVWKFQQEQHEWLKARFLEISKEHTQLEVPKFPSWVLQEQEEEKTAEQPPVKKAKRGKALKRKREMRKLKGKKKVGESEEEEEVNSEDLIDTEEDEQVRKIVKDMEKNEDEEDGETNFEEERDSDLDLTMEELLRKRNTEKGTHEPVLTPISPSRQQKQQQSKPQTPPPPPSSSSSSSIQADSTPPSSPIKTTTIQEDPKEKAPTPPQEPNLETTNLVSESIPMQVIEENPLEEAAEVMLKQAQGEGQPKETTAATDATALGASASQKTPEAVLTCIPKNKEDNTKIVIEELAAKKREGLGNTQKFFINISEIAKVVQESSMAGGVEGVPEKEVEKEQGGTDEGGDQEGPKENQQKQKQRCKNNLLQLH